MNYWEKLSEEANIVLVGNFNSKIFHPEWFIRRSIVEEWDYSGDELLNLPDMSQFTLPNEIKIIVLQNKLILRSSRASVYESLKDFISSTFAILKETPIHQIGMNYSSNIEIQDNKKWMQFGEKLAPKSHWEQTVGYLKNLELEKEKHFGLWELVMNLPREDNLPGFIRPKITAVEGSKNILSFSVNNHFVIKDSAARNMIKTLEENWDSSLTFSRELITNMMDAQLMDLE